MTNKEILVRLYKDYTSKFLRRILIAGIFSILVAGSTSSIAYLLDPAIKKIFVDKDQTLIYLIPIAIILAFSMKGFSLYFAKVNMIHVAENVKKNIQSDMMTSLIKADTKVIDSKHTGKIVSNLIVDTNVIVNLVSVVLLNLFKDTLTLFGLLFVMFYQNWKLSLIAIIMIPFASYTAQKLGKKIGKVSTIGMESAGFLNTHLMEIFKNHKLMKIFQRENYENARINQKLEKVKNAAKKISTIFVRVSPIMETLTGIMIALLIFYSGKLIIKGEININNFFSFLAAMMLAYQPVRSLATLNMGIQAGLSAARRILPVIDQKIDIKDNIDCKDLNIKNGEINFNNVCFKYDLDNDNLNVLDKININIPGGKMTALVGHSGSGKSTILNLIPRFYNVTSGEIKIDDQSINNLSINSLRKEISLVSQDTTLFDDTIKNNIAYANLEASDEEITEAAKNSFASEFIEKLPDEYNTLIGENGLRLSGGEKQRISIARAMLKKSTIILLDEATSSLDADTEQKIQKALTLLTKNKTTVVIAHRLSTVLNSDQIYVVDTGKVIAKGSHDELLKNSPIYKNFYDKQITKN
ncbi:ABC transporter ATP-binding protein/permease [Candidatus Pelagibacter sp.]|jgi:ATP-binding cassette, subfamily B, bacterial MsbA|nr:ABC transporter ATP-binding protein/permease [Candidatus Pelagibacter sp.]